MTGSYFTLLNEVPDSARFAASPATVGPWSSRLQHGGPPNALAVTWAERALATATQRRDLLAVRLAADFVGPVPVGEIDVRTSVVRVARSAALVEATLVGDGRDCLRASVWFIRDADTAQISPPLPELRSVPDVPAGVDATFGYGESLEWRFVTGAMGVPGPGAAWIRPTVPLLPGHDMSGLARVALIADSASGISAELDWSRWSFVNVDLDVHLARPVEGEWVLMEARTHLGAHGSGLCTSTMSDLRGVVGGGMQTLVVSPISPDWIP